MTLRVFNFLLLVLLANTAFSQFKLSGKVISSDRAEAVENVNVLIDRQKPVYSNQNGEFSFSGLSKGKYTIIIRSTDHKSFSQAIFIAGDTAVTLIIHPKNETLSEVEVSAKQNDFGRTRMRGVENMGIYEGKKSEVIVVDQLIANLATNNARQVYSRVPGLNIWENDGAGIQLSVGGRGLDPNRTSNFNVRQNGYDISADALGYPESYYTPPIEGVSRIQVVRGAASLQYGTQFGGLLNFVMRKPNPNRKLEVIARQTLGSFGFYNAFTSASGTTGRLSYYTFFQYKKGDGWRPNSHFENYNVFSNVNYQISEKSSVGLDITVMNYLAQQPGGLTDNMFRDNPRQSNRERNWFQVNWNLMAVHFDHKFNEQNEFNVRVFGLYANRYSLGFRPNRVATIDDNSERDLIKGQFTNFGAEARFLHRYELLKRQAVLLAGTRYYNGFNHSQQGLGSTGKDANFNFVEPDRFITYDYSFPNQNVALFAEQVWYVSDKISVTPGIRTEFIDTKAKGYYGFISKDLAGNIINISRNDERRVDVRKFVLGGIGVSFKPLEKIDIYGNVSQNYRSITFSDMRVNNPSSVIDGNLTDEKGYSIDLGIRSNRTSVLNYDLGLFYLDYNNRIGEIQFADESNRILRLRTNVGRAVIKGIEAYAELDVLRARNPENENWSGVVFGNVAVIKSEYKNSKAPGVNGNQVEFVPNLNVKTGVRISYKKIKASFQYTYLSDQSQYEAFKRIRGEFLTAPYPASTAVVVGFVFPGMLCEIEMYWKGSYSTGAAAVITVWSPCWNRLLIV